MKWFFAGIHKVLILGFLVTSLHAAQKNSATAATKDQAGTLIDFADQESVNRHRPIIIAHRGGVVAKGSPECSLTAIRAAADQGYDMVELDIQMSQDGVPMVFHDRNLKKSCGRNVRVEDLPAVELELISYLNATDRIVRLTQALELCRQLRLGVMLDLKSGRDSTEFLESINRILEKSELTNATISISGSHAARRYLKHVRFTPTKDEMTRLRSGELLNLKHRFWFGLPHQLQPGDIGKLKSSGALIIPAINTFRYSADSHMKDARADMERLLPKVDGFQIDSIYFSFLSDKKR